MAKGDFRRARGIMPNTSGEPPEVTIRRMRDGDALGMDNVLFAAEQLDALRETIEDLVQQFACKTKVDGVPALWTGGLSALEGAFHALGWKDPHPYPEGACAVEGCNDWATCGTLTPDGYKLLCGMHYREVKGT